MSTDRQTHLVAGILVWTGLILGLTVAPGWFVVAALPGFGLLLHATTGICPMTLLLRRAPWNRNVRTA